MCMHSLVRWMPNFQTAPRNQPVFANCSRRRIVLFEPNSGSTMPTKNGPASLAAYHQQQLDLERNKGKKPMPATSFDTEKQDPETAKVAAENVARILGKTEPAATPQGNAPPPTAPPAEAPKASRMTVAKILQGYQEKEKTFTTDIGKIDGIIASYQKKRDETAFRLSVLQEMIAEITKPE